MAHTSRRLSFGINTPTASAIEPYEHNQFDYLMATVREALKKWNGCSPSIFIQQSSSGTIGLYVDLTVYTEESGVQSEFLVPDEEDVIDNEALPIEREAYNSINSALFVAGLYSSNPS